MKTKKNKDIIEALNRQYEDSTPLIPFSALLYLILWCLMIAYMVKDSSSQKPPREIIGHIK